MRRGILIIALLLWAGAARSQTAQQNGAAYSGAVDASVDASVSSRVDATPPSIANGSASPVSRKPTEKLQSVRGAKPPVPAHAAEGVAREGRAVPAKGSLATNAMPAKWRSAAATTSPKNGKRSLSGMPMPGDTGETGASSSVATAERTPTNESLSKLGLATEPKSGGLGLSPAPRGRREFQPKTASKSASMTGEPRRMNRTLAGKTSARKLKSLKQRSAEERHSSCASCPN